jgi:membrane protein implicated in regulation of membrane protease activity
MLLGGGVIGLAACSCYVAVTWTGYAILAISACGALLLLYALSVSGLLKLCIVLASSFILRKRVRFAVRSADGTMEMKCPKCGAKAQASHPAPSTPAFTCEQCGASGTWT